MEKKFLAKKYAVQAPTPMGKSDQLAKSFDDCINLSLGDPDLITDNIIIENAFKDAASGHTKYTEFRGDPELRKEISLFYIQEYGIRIPDKEIFVCASGCLAMYLALEAVVDDGEEVIIPGPFFTPYPQQVELAGGVPVELPTYEEEDFQINGERLESLITDKTKAIIINSPNNPTGAMQRKETLLDIARIAGKYDIVVIADDIYTSFSYSMPFVPIISMPEMRERTITINSFSKNFTMTGWRVGNIIAPEHIINAVQQINENVVFTAPSISQRAALHALRNRERIQPPMVEEYRKRLYFAAEKINSIKGLSAGYPPCGSFYLFVNIKKTGMSSRDFADFLLEKAHVLVLPGSAFGQSGEGYVRIACTVGIPQLTEAAKRIENALDQLKEQDRDKYE